MDNINWTKVGIWAGVGIVALIIFTLVNPIFIVKAGERGVVLRVGSVNRVVIDGIHLRTPFLEYVEKMNVQTQKEQVEAGAASKDLQTVSAVIALNYNLKPESVGLLYANIGNEYKSKIIDPAIQESVKAATAKYTAEELITKRESVKEDIKLSLTERLATEYVTVTEVSIVDFDFSKSFNDAIEAKVTAEQNALAAKNLLEQKKYEAQQVVVTAQAQAEAIRIQAQAINSQDGADYVQLQAINKWKGEVPTYMMGNAVPFINLK